MPETLSRHDFSSKHPARCSCWAGPWLGFPATNTTFFDSAAEAVVTDDIRATDTRRITKAIGQVNARLNLNARATVESSSLPASAVTVNGFISFVCVYR